LEYLKFIHFSPTLHASDLCQKEELGSYLMRFHLFIPCSICSLAETPIRHFSSENPLDDVFLSFHPWKSKSSHFGLNFVMVVCIILCEDPGEQV
jgi:hypothetical protein